MHDTVASRVADIFPVGTWGVGRWQSTTGRFNQSSDTAYSDVRIDEAITQCDRPPTLLLLQCLLPIGLA